MHDASKRKREKFLAALAETANVTSSCKRANVQRDTIYRWKAEDEAFAKAMAAAVDRGADALEDEAVRRGHDGVLKPVYQKGEKVGEVREYSDQLLMFLLRGARPEKYKDRGTLDLNIVANLAGRLNAARKRRQARS